MYTSKAKLFVCDEKGHNDRTFVHFLLCSRCPCGFPSRAPCSSPSFTPLGKKNMWFKWVCLNTTGNTQHTQQRTFLSLQKTWAKRELKMCKTGRGHYIGLVSSKVKFVASCPDRSRGKNAPGGLVCICPSLMHLCVLSRVAPRNGHGVHHVLILDCTAPCDHAVRCWPSHALRGSQHLALKSEQVTESPGQRQGSTQTRKQLIKLWSHSPLTFMYLVPGKTLNCVHGG